MRSVLKMRQIKELTVNATLDANQDLRITGKQRNSSAPLSSAEMLAYAPAFLRAMPGRQAVPAIR